MRKLKMSTGECFSGHVSWQHEIHTHIKIHSESRRHAIVVVGESILIKRQKRSKRD